VRTVIRSRWPVALAFATALGLVAGLLLSMWFARGESQERARAVAEAERAEAARMRAQATLAAINQVFSAGNSTIAGHPDVLFRDALLSGAERIGELPADVRATVLYALAEAQGSIGEIDTALANFQESATSAREANDVQTRLRAQLRRAGMLFEHVNHREFAVAYDELLADPALAGDPLVHASILALGVLDARWLGHLRTSDERIDQALALWPVPTGEDDGLLRAELETRLLVAQAQRLARTPGDKAKLLAHVEQMRSAVDRLRSTLGNEHPLLVALRSYADVLPGVLEQREDALVGLLDETKRAAAELGAGHPGVRARIDVALHFHGSAPAAGQMEEIERLALQSARALPSGSIWRAHTTAALLESNATQAFAELLTPEEVVEIGRLRCRDAPPADADCLEGMAAAARMMRLAGRPSEAIVILRGALGELPPDADAGSVAALNGQLQRVLHQDGRFDEAAAAAAAAIAAIESNDELDEVVREQLIHDIASRQAQPGDSET